FGISSALQRQISDAWTRGDRAGVDRAIACGMNFYTAMALVQMVALGSVAYGALPYTAYQGRSYDLGLKILWLQMVTAPCYGFSVVVSSVLQAARRYDFVPRFELLITILRFLVLWVGVKWGGTSFPEVTSAIAGSWPTALGLRSAVDFFSVVLAQTIVQ